MRRAQTTAGLDFAYATRSVLYVMAAIMAAAAVVALVGLRAGLQEETLSPTTDFDPQPSSGPAGEAIGSAFPEAPGTS